MDAPEPAQVPRREPFLASLAVGWRALRIPLGTAALLAGIVAVGHGMTSSTPWILLGLLAWTWGGPVLLAAGVICLLRRGKVFERLLATVIGGAAFLALLVPANFLGGSLLDIRVEGWKRRGEEIAAFAEAWRARTGASPRTLEGTAGAPSPMGTLTYSSDGRSFEIIVRNPRSFIGWDGWEWTGKSWKYFWD